MIVAKGHADGHGFRAQPWASVFLSAAHSSRDAAAHARSIVAVVASYVASMVWTAVGQLCSRPGLRSAFGVRDRRCSATVFQVFNGAVYNAFTMLAWSVLYIGIRYYAALQAERERSLKAEAAAHQAQLEALRYQINPHFLFNSLNAVSTLVTERRNDEAARMLSRVSDFLRLTLTAPVRDEVALADEVDYVRQYLDIERVRFGDRLRTSRSTLRPMRGRRRSRVRAAAADRERGSPRDRTARVRRHDHDRGAASGRRAPSVDHRRRPRRSRRIRAATERGRIGLANTRDRLRQSMAIVAASSSRTARRRHARDDRDPVSAPPSIRPQRPRRIDSGSRMAGGER